MPILMAPTVAGQKRTWRREINSFEEFPEGYERGFLELG
jgi:hypothetical protein